MLLTLLEEANRMTAILNDKVKKECFKIKLDKLLKRYKYPSSESIDDETIDKMLLEDQQQKKSIEEEVGN
jgi:hypothetical protein